MIIFKSNIIKQNKLESTVKYPKNLNVFGKSSISICKYKENDAIPKTNNLKIREKLKEFIKAYFDTDYFQSAIKRIASTGSTRDYVGITAQQDLPFFIPDEKLQDRFVEFFNIKFSEKKNKMGEINNLETKRSEMIEKRFVE